jgi:hypothetical protein
MTNWTLDPEDVADPQEYFDAELIPALQAGCFHRAAKPEWLRIIGDQLEYALAVVRAAQAEKEAKT